MLQLTQVSAGNQGYLQILQSTINPIWLLLHLAYSVNELDDDELKDKKRKLLIFLQLYLQCFYFTNCQALYELK